MSQSPILYFRGTILVVNKIVSILHENVGAGRANRSLLRTLKTPFLISPAKSARIPQGVQKHYYIDLYVFVWAFGSMGLWE